MGGALPPLPHLTSWRAWNFTFKTAEAPHYAIKSFERSTNTKLHCCQTYLQKYLYPGWAVLSHVLTGVISLEIIRDSCSNSVMDRRPWSVTFHIMAWHITIIKIHLFEGTSTVSSSAWRIQGRGLLRCFATDKQSYRRTADIVTAVRLRLSCGKWYPVVCR